MDSSSSSSRTPTSRSSSPSFRRVVDRQRYRERCRTRSRSRSPSPLRNNNYNNNNDNNHKKSPDLYPDERVNKKKKFKNFQRGAAELNDPICQNALGICYKTGKLGVTPDFKLSMHYFNLAAAQGNCDAQYNLAINYEFGEDGVTENFQEAYRLYRLAAQKEMPRAQYALGDWYERGEQEVYGGGPQKDRNEARLWYTRALLNGHEHAVTRLEKMSQNR